MLRLHGGILDRHYRRSLHASSLRGCRFPLLIGFILETFGQATHASNDHFGLHAASGIVQRSLALPGHFKHQRGSYLSLRLPLSPRIPFERATSEHVEAFHAAVFQTRRGEADGSAEYGYRSGSLREVAEIAGGSDYDLDGRVFVDWVQGQLRVASADEQSAAVFGEDGSEVGSFDRFVRLKAREEARRFPR